MTQTMGWALVAILGLFLAFLAVLLTSAYRRAFAPAKAPQGPPERQETSTEQVVQQAMPLDPDNPPRWRTYNPRPEAPMRYCDCHDEALESGQRILWWPLPGGKGAVMLFCERAVPEEAK